MKAKIIFSCTFLILFFFGEVKKAHSQNEKKIWSKQYSIAWYKKNGWQTGSNFLPSTAINQLEMWEAETFDTTTISRELGLAEDLGFTTMRVFLHNLVWENVATAFKHRIHTFLTIASRHHIKPLFVFFDDCWNPEPKYGKQPDPKPGIHNSGWMRSPSQTVHNDSTKWEILEKYVKDILTSFKNDNRILLWDLYNEPGNSGYNETSLPLLKDIFTWAWSVRPSQPLTAGIWYDNKILTDYQLASSDVISFHNYGDAGSMENEIKDLAKYGRPIICTEYMARTRGSKFQTHLPLMKKYNVSAINWGFVSGKSNTIYQWDTPVPDGSEPKIWFHDIYRQDGSPFDPGEIKLIRSMTGKPE